MKKEKVIVLASGGLDSAVLLAYCIKKNFNPIVLSFDYGQDNIKELKALNKVISFYEADYRIKIQYIQRKIKLFKEHALNKDNSYVPYRNTIFLSFAISLAETLKVNKIFYGAVSGESELNLPEFKDTTSNYMNAFNAFIKKSSDCKIKLFAPFINTPKSKVVKWGLKNGVPINLTWSCYENKKISCKKCSACKLREIALIKNGLKGGDSMSANKGGGGAKTKGKKGAKGAAKTKKTARKVKR